MNRRELIDGQVVNLRPRDEVVLIQGEKQILYGDDLVKSEGEKRYVFRKSRDKPDGRRRCLRVHVPRLEDDQGWEYLGW